MRHPLFCVRRINFMNLPSREFWLVVREYYAFHDFFILFPYIIDVLCFFFNADVMLSNGLWHKNQLNKLTKFFVVCIIIKYSRNGSSRRNLIERILKWNERMGNENNCLKLWNSIFFFSCGFNQFSWNPQTYFDFLDCFIIISFIFNTLDHLGAELITTFENKELLLLKFHILSFINSRITNWVSGRKTKALLVYQARLKLIIIQN